MAGNLLRNVITTQYCSAIIDPSIMEKFRKVNDVKVLLSGDPCFNDAVVAKGGTVQIFGIRILIGLIACAFMGEFIPISKVL